MPNDTTLRSLIHAALDSSPIPELDVTTIHRRASLPVRRESTRRKHRIAAIALAISIPVVAFAATPQSMIRATLHQLAIAYFGPKATSGLARALPGAGERQQMVRIMNNFKDTSTKSVTFINGKIVHPIPLTDAVKQASHDFRVVLPRHLPAGAAITTAIYAGGTLSYGYSLRGGGVLNVTIERANATNLKPVHQLAAFTARFAKDGRLIRSTRVNVARFALADETITLLSARLSAAQLLSVGKQMGGREIGSSE